MHDDDQTRGTRASFLLLALLGLLVPEHARAQEVSLPLGTDAPDVALEDLDGTPVQLADYLSGGPALIEFWASWCENCEALQPQLDQIQARFGDRLSLVAVAVAVSQSQRRVRRHLEDHDPGYPFLWDGQGNAVRAYQAATTAIIVLVDAQGKVAYTGVGADQDVVGAVEALLGTGS
jgi:thiol-disulfide isomerase/thioredoxin